MKKARIGEITKLFRILKQCRKQKNGLQEVIGVLSPQSIDDLLESIFNLVSLVD